MKKYPIDTYSLNLFPDSEDNSIKDNHLLKNQIIDFGQYKGQPFQILENYPDYCKYLLTRPDFKNKHFAVYQFIINNFNIPNDTPEHNLLQTRFLDEKFCLALARLCGWSLMNKTRCI